MNYPKVLYKGAQYTDYQQLSADIHAHKVAQVIIASEEEEADVRADGFGELGDLMGVKAVQEESAPEFGETPKRRGMPKGGWPKKATA